MSAPADDDRIKAVFQAALDEPTAARAAFLERACAGDAALRRGVDRLLAAFAAADDFLEQPATASILDQELEATERPGDRIGDFELTERLGEGGFGIVWAAQQLAPVRRDVAIKIVKLGLDTMEVVRRFTQERDVLARMDHPGIAKVFDAGVTADGRPWFAMERVDGEAITRFCDRRRLGTRERLELFVDVCRAVQHAHHHGIVHRDIKPGNVLVGERDGRAVPRVIDFGIAKALDRSAAQRTALSAERRMLGTPEYMSPEQVETWGADVDARTDVYSLGVLLFELVSGSRPFDLRRLGPGRFEELVRRIRETDPDRPSSRIASLSPSEAGEILAARRAAGPELRRALQGDIDWIVMRALRKDRELRYATPTELAADIQRHLRHEPVSAGPPGLGYRLRKLARRHRLAVVLVGVAALSLLAGTAFAVRGMLRATAAEASERVAHAAARDRQHEAELEAARARREARRAELAFAAVEDLLTAADPRRQLGPELTVRALLTDFGARLRDRVADGDPALTARLSALVGRTLRELGDLGAADVHLTRALALREALDDVPARMQSRLDLAWLRHDQGRGREAVACADPVVAHHAAERPGTLAHAAALKARSQFHALVGDLSLARADASTALQICRARHGEDHPDVARCRAQCALLDVRAGTAANPRATLEEAIEILEPHVGSDHPELASLRHDLGAVLESAAEYDAAEASYRGALQSRLRVGGAASVGVASSRIALGHLLAQRGRIDEGLELLTAGTESARASLGAGHRITLRGQVRLGAARTAAGATAAAIATLRDAVERLDAAQEASPVDRAEAGANLAAALWQAGSRDAAVAALDRCRAAADAALPPRHSLRVSLAANRGTMAAALGDVATARACYEEALAHGRRLWSDGHPHLTLVERFLAALRDD